jgi:tetratricopeptide (TPR) repeat protein
MAPEQAEGRLDLIDERTDVYGLGAILYEILTGQVPFTGTDTQAILQRVVHEPPERPRQVVPGVSRALEAVCLRALAKHPRERYPSARALADEVRHWLADEPVTAYAEPWSARARRWTGRHRTLVTAGAAAVLVAAVSLAVATVLLGDANRRIQASRQEAERQRDQARANFQLARDAVDEYCTKVSDDPRLKEKDLESLRNELLRTAAKFHEKFVERRQDDPNERADLGRAYLRLARLTGTVATRDKAIPLFEQGLAIFRTLAAEHPDSAEYQDELASAETSLAGWLGDTGRRPEAADAYHRAQAIWEKLTQEYPENASYAVGLGGVYCDTAELVRRDGQSEEGLHWFDRAVQTLEDARRRDRDNEKAPRYLGNSYEGLGNNYRVLGRPKEGLAACLKAVPLREELLKKNANIPLYEQDYSRTLHVLALLYEDLNQMDEAVATLHKALAIVERMAAAHPNVISLRQDVAGTRLNLGNSCRRLKRLAEAEDNYRQALAIYLDLTQHHADILQYRMELALVYTDLGGIRLDAGRLDEAAEFFRQEVDLLTALDMAYPRVLELHMGLTGAYLRLITNYKEQGRSERIAALSAPILALRKHLAGVGPKKVDLAMQCGAACDNLGPVLVALKRPDEATASYEQAVHIFQAVLAEDKTHAGAHDLLANTYIGLGELQKTLDKKGTAADVEKLYRQAVALREQLVADHPKAAAYQIALGNLQNNFAILYYQANKFDQALAWNNTALKVRERLVSEHAHVDAYQADVAMSLFNLANTYDKLHKPDDALASSRRAYDIDDKLVADHPKVDRYQTDLARTCNQLGLLYARRNEVDPALEAFERERDMNRRLRKAHPKVTGYELDLARTQRKLGEFYLVKPKPGPAAEAFQEAASLFDRLLSGAKPAAVAGYRGELAQSYAGLGKAHAVAGRFDDAFSAFDRAGAVMAKLEPASPALVLCRAALVQGCVRLGERCMKDKKHEPALQAFRRAQAPARLLVAAAPKNTTYQDHLIAAYLDAGSLEAMAGRMDQALATYRQLLPLLGPMDAARLPVKSALAALVKNLGNLGDHYVAKKKAEPAAEAFELALVEARKLAATQPGESAHLGTIALTCRKLGPVYLVLRKPERALGTYREELSAFEQLAARRPGVAVVVTLCGAAHHDIGHVLHGMGKHEDSLAEFDRAIALLDDALKHEKAPQLRRGAEAWMCTSQGGRAHALWHLKRYPESAAAYDKALALAKPDQRLHWLPEHASVLARTGAYTRAVAEAEEVAGVKSATPLGLYDAACALSLASAAAAKDSKLSDGEKKKRVEEYAARAVAVLHRAKEAGVFKNPGQIAHMKQDSDLDNLRQRPDYRRLVAELEGTPKQAGK